jgi:hypothetical protein
MVRIMDLRTALVGLCYDIELRLRNAEQPKDVMLWAHDKILIMIKHWEQNEKDRKKYNIKKIEDESQLTDVYDNQFINEY